ncbi:MAG: sugar phosphate isomerase/epimerase [Clostridiales bacterium]|nr:sugar phosphate isomerase/epimerase [Clostridiales bacterium]
MLKSGLVSVTFRNLSCEKIIDLCKVNNLNGIEWGSDVHIMPGDYEKAKRVALLTEEAGLQSFSYGTYYHLGDTKEESQIVSSAKIMLETARLLHADTVRIWAGRKGSEEYMGDEISAIVRETCILSDTAKEYGIYFSFECHPNTLTDNYYSSVDFMKMINRNNIKLYWQPNQHHDFEYNLNAVKMMKPYLTNVHVFNWHGFPEKKEPLFFAADEWLEYLRIINSAGGEHRCLLEFMPDNRPESLPPEANTLNEWIDEINKKYSRYGNR